MIYGFPELVAAISGRGEIRIYKIARATNTTTNGLTWACTYSNHTPTGAICHALSAALETTEEPSDFGQVSLSHEHSWKRLPPLIIFNSSCLSGRVIAVHTVANISNNRQS